MLEGNFDLKMQVLERRCILTLGNQRSLGHIYSILCFAFVFGYTAPELSSYFCVHI